MEKSMNSSSLGAQSNQQETQFQPAANGFTFKLIRAFFAVFIITSLVVGLWTHTWHNIMFAGMFYCLYKAIKYEDYSNGRKK